MPEPKQPRTRPSIRQTPPLPFFALVAILAHGMVLGAAWWATGLRPKAHLATSAAATWSAASSRDPRVQEALQATRKALRRKPLPQMPQKPKPPVRGTVVDLPPSQDRRPPPEAAFLAQHDARTDKQTRSRHASSRFKNALNEPREGLQTPQAASARKPQSAAEEAVAQQRSSASRNASQPQAQPYVLKFPNSQRPGPSVRAQETPQTTGSLGQQGAAGGPSPGPQPLTMAQLVPNITTLSQMGGGPKNDVSLDIPEGEGTFLNARAFKYASFFNRLKEQIGNYWRPLGEYAARDPTGNIYGTRNRLTVLSIALDAQGALENVQLVESSGIDFLDDEGIRAVRAAAPFMHPPRGLLDADGRIVFHFAFSLDMSGALSRGP